MRLKQNSRRLRSYLQPAIFILVIVFYISQLRSEGTHNMSYYVLWARSIVEGHLLEIYHATSGTLFQSSDSLTVPYTPLSQYLIAGSSWLLLHVLGNSRETYLLAVNSTCTLFTFFTALLFFRNRRILNIRQPLAYLLTPAVFLISPLLGYEDSIMSFFLVATLISLKKNRYLLGGLLAGCAVLSKQLALMPIFAIFLLLVCSKKIKPFIEFLAGAIFSSFVILTPFIFTGNIMWYFKAQSLTSVHTMASAQAANFPWLVSLIYRISTLGLIDGLGVGGNGLRISSDTLRQASYLSSGLVTVLVFLSWAIYWGKKGGMQNLDLSFSAMIMIFSYHLFNFGVHENHIFMLLPVVYLISGYLEIWNIYKMVALALTTVLISAYGVGSASHEAIGIATTHPGIFSVIMGICFLLYVVAFIKALKVNPHNLGGTSFPKPLVRLLGSYLNGSPPARLRTEITRQTRKIRSLL